MPTTLRAPSPASSVGTTYPADQTSFSDLEENCPQHQFEARCQTQLRLFQPPEPEEKFVLDPNFPLLGPIPQTDVDRNHILHLNLDSLRKVVKGLEDNELYEQTKLKGSQVALPYDPHTRDIDDILFSMIDLPPPPSPQSPPHSPPINSFNTTGTATGRRLSNAPSYKGKMKSQKK